PPNTALVPFTTRFRSLQIHQCFITGLGEADFPQGILSLLPDRPSRALKLVRTGVGLGCRVRSRREVAGTGGAVRSHEEQTDRDRDRKSTRLYSSHVKI